MSLSNEQLLALQTQGAPLPQLAGKGASAMANLVSLYRFVDNDGASLDEMRRIRARTLVGKPPPSDGRPRQLPSKKAGAAPTSPAS